MRSPMVVDVFKEQLATIMEWHRRDLPSFKWGVVLHRRNERGRIRFGAVTSGGESMVLTSELLDELSRMSCWLDGAVRVRLECRSTADLPAEWAAADRPDRAALVRSLAVYFDPGATGPDALGHHDARARMRILVAHGDPANHRSVGSGAGHHQPGRTPRWRGTGCGRSARIDPARRASQAARQGDQQGNQGAGRQHGPSMSRGAGTRKGEAAATDSG